MQIIQKVRRLPIGYLERRKLANYKKLYEINQETTFTKFSQSSKKLSFEKVKQLFNNPEALMKYYFNNSENYTCCQVFRAALEGKDFENFRKILQSSVEKVIDKLQKLFNFQDSTNKITLYRGIVLFEVEPDLEHLGICWSYEKAGAVDWVNNLCSEEDPNDAPCILTGETTMDNVDWLMTVALLVDSPEEKEIRIWDEKKITLLDYTVL